MIGIPQGIQRIFYRHHDKPLIALRLVLLIEFIILLHAPAAVRKRVKSYDDVLRLSDS